MCLRSQKGRVGERTFADDFLDWLEANGNFDGLTLRAIPEGRVIHPNVPIAVVRGPLAMAQILETPLKSSLVVNGADHSLEVPGNPMQSLQELSRLTESLSSFLS